MFWHPSFPFQPSASASLFSSILPNPYFDIRLIFLVTYFQCTNVALFTYSHSSMLSNVGKTYYIWTVMWCCLPLTDGCMLHAMAWRTRRRRSWLSNTATTACSAALWLECRGLVSNIHDSNRRHPILINELFCFSTINFDDANIFSSWMLFSAWN